MNILCAFCGNKAQLKTGHINRALKLGMRIFCDKKCAGLARRKPQKTKIQKIEEKRQYDAQYRHLNAEIIKQKKREYFQLTYDPLKAAEQRKKRMPLHVEYCRQPRYKVYKQQYDRSFRARKMFGPYADSFLLLVNIDKEVNSRMSDYDVRIANGTFNKALNRRRAYEQLISNKFEAGVMGNSERYQERQNASVTR